jgi:hypothetical protein
MKKDYNYYFKKCKEAFMVNDLKKAEYYKKKAWELKL